MTTAQLDKLVGSLHRIAAGTDAAIDDRELMHRFLAGREEQAFVALVRRHAPMVLGVCRRILGDSHAADDAFQATFLVMVQKAESLRDPGRLAAWLHGVASRVALKARSTAAVRRRRFEPLDSDHAMGECENASVSEACSVLDAELARLPDKYRAPLMLCYLHGETKSQAAQRLGWPEGTVSTRLARGRALLRDRLLRRGVSLAGIAAALELSRGALCACPPVSLVRNTVQQCAALAGGSAPASSAFVHSLVQGVLRSMWYTKCKIIAAGAVIVAAAGLMATMGAREALASRPSATYGHGERSAFHLANIGVDEFAWQFPIFTDQKIKKEQGPSVRGVVKSVDVGRKSILLTVVNVVDGQKTSEEKSFEIATDAKVMLLESTNKTDPPPEGKLHDLSPGTGVEMRLDADGKKAVAIYAHGPLIHGLLRSFDAASGALTFALKTKSGLEEQTATMIKDVKISLDNPLAKKSDPPQEGQFGDLSEGSAIGVQLSVDRKRVLAVRILGATVFGKLVGYDSGNSTITVTMKSDAQIVEKSFKVHKEARLGDLEVGLPVVLHFAPRDKETVVAAQTKKIDK